ncbi:dehydrogenase, FAD-dependent [Clostridium tetani]|uniref:Dehydrogenase, FAD-dependent n=1 Tax=Clostridium tetani (strain Massachusetts / E88) TaxID=212717 RepID=Q899T4_CLOTE|nr:dehydrogenase, FAD-dependent [Clostridium tetani E88]SKA17630.1 L-2-hydroxyglutarate oxidase LhgO [Clostridium tetani]SUY54207.1 dehydrogenase, FAD-dependent [Clostridium tetani]SUY65210.1 dehydrogenase, FAD-dependent [Clostridium tetani]BDR63078.1 FAD/NAD(P)-binding oxidoreductase [Clostridium tetani]
MIYIHINLPKGMKVVDYDVLILGGGIVGCAIAYELSKYSLNIALIEKDYDIADDVALFNSSIVYDGVESKDTLTAKLEMMGSKILDELCPKINVPFKRRPSILIAQNEEDVGKLHNIYKRSEDRQINDVYLMEKEDVKDLEPYLNVEVKKALYSKNTGIICPYDLAIAYGEIAFDNGVKFRLEEEVLDIEKITKGFRVVTNKNKFTCKMVINTTPRQNYNIDTSKNLRKSEGYLNYFILNDEHNYKHNNLLFILGKDEEDLFKVHSLQGNTILILKSKKSLSYTEALGKVKDVVSNLEEEKIDIFYQEPFYKESAIIDESLVDTGYIKILSKHYGEVTVTPAIAKMICETVVNNLNSILKKDFIDKRREVYRFRDLSNEEIDKIIKLDKRYGNIICKCQKISEGEIIDAIRRPLGARTLEGIKRRTGATYGECRGSGCLNKIIKILARETNKKVTEIVKDSKSSIIVGARIKEFD